jgi:hypothetical protein
LDGHYIRVRAQRDARESLDLFIMMLEDGVFPNNVTMLSVIQACSLMGASELFSPVHALVVLLDLEDDASVVNSLILVYRRCGKYSVSLAKKPASAD